MSTDYFLACPKCKRAHAIGSVGFSGYQWYGDTEHCRDMIQWLDAHLMSDCTASVPGFVVIDEHTLWDGDEYTQWEGARLIPADPDPDDDRDVS